MVHYGCFIFICFLAPGKRPLSTITPTIIESEDNAIELAVGGSGGSQILTATLNVTFCIYIFILKKVYLGHFEYL